MTRTILCTFPTRSDAVRAVDELKAAGFAPSSLSVLFKDTTEARSFAQDAHIHEPDELDGDGRSGGFAYGALGMLAGAMLMASIPGVGLFLGFGPIVAGIIGMASGFRSDVGAALHSLGIDHGIAREFRKKLDHDAVLVGVETEDEIARVRAVALLERLGSEDVYVSVHGYAHQHASP